VKYTTYFLILSGLAYGADPQWKIQYFYDKLHEVLDIEDLAFPSATHGIAVGGIIDETGLHKPRPMALVTADGGEHWTTQGLPDEPRSIFFLNESTGWLVSEGAIWITEEGGRAWKKISEQRKPDKKLGPAPPGGLITRVWFVDEQHGFAVGYQKTALETKDGGKTWSSLEAAEKTAVNASYTAYTQIGFDGKNGMIIGGATPPHGDDPKVPSWMEPERATTRRRLPNVALLVSTLDGGKQWNATSLPVYGNVVGLRVTGTKALAIFSFNESYEFPTEVYRVDLASKASADVFREKDRRVTDLSIYPAKAFLAAVEPPGKLTIAPIPGKVRMLASTNLTDWTEMKVDYKANARAVILAGTDADHQWAATDTGMILHLVQ
jgi:Photosynthesis system II assembly factor YCF48